MTGQWRCDGHTAADAGTGVRPFYWKWDLPLLLFLHVLGLRKLPSANHCSLRPPSRELGAESVIGALDLLPTYFCLRECDYW